MHSRVDLIPSIVTDAGNDSNGKIQVNISNESASFSNASYAYVSEQAQVIVVTILNSLENTEYNL